MELFDTVHVALERAISGAGLRHEALSENLANINTPGYQRRDVDFHSTLQSAMAAGKEAVAGAPIAAQVDSSSAMRADGNSVDVDVENANLAQNALESEALTSVLKARGDIIEIALGVR